MTGNDGEQTGRGADPGPGRPLPGRERADPMFPEAVLEVRWWPDPVLDQLGHDPRSGYVERFWLPVLGPSCLLLIRRAAAELERNPAGFTLETTVWAKELGIGMKGGRHGPFWRALERASRFGATRRNGSRLAVRRRLAPLTARQVGRLPPTLQAAHMEWEAERLTRTRRPTVTRWTPHPDDGPEERDAGPGALDDAA